MLSAVFGIGALVLPVVVPPARRAAGKPAHQYYVEDNAVRLSSFFVFVCRWLALTFFFFWLSLFFCLLLLWRPFSLSFSRGQHLHPAATRDVKPDFTDAKALAQFSKHDAYRYATTAPLKE